MLILIPFTNWDLLFGNSTMLEQQQRVIKIICPSPNVADSVRIELAGRADVNYNVITISRFINDLIQLRPTLDQNVRVMRKSELMFELAALFKKKFLRSKKYKTELNFDRLFKIFTEVRSITTNTTLLEEFLQTLDDSEAEALYYFLEYNKMMKFLDEHEVYQNLAKDVQDADLNENECFIFYGFKHLSGQQVDFLKGFSIKHICVVTAPEYLLKNATSQDWTSWIGFSSELKPLENTDANIFKLRIVYYNRGDISGAIKRFLEINDNSFKKVLIASSKSELEQITSLPINNLSFKTSIDIFETAKTRWQKNLKELLPDPLKPIKFNDVIDILDKEMKVSIIEENFIMTKLIQIWKNNLNEWKNFGEIFQSLDEFDLTIIGQKVELDLPRVNSIIMKKSEEGITVENLSTYSNLNMEGVAVIGTGDTFKVASDLHDLANAWELLSAVGPLHSKNFELLDRKEKLFHAVSMNGSVLFLENGLQEHDAGWSEFLLKFEKNTITVDQPAPDNISDPINNIIIEEKKSRKHSPSSLQIYRECPRKYLYSVASPVKPRYSNIGDISFAQQGDIEHKLIKDYFEKGQVVALNAQALMMPYVNSEFFIINKLNTEYIREQIIEHANNGIEFIKKILKLKNNSKLFFEHIYEDEYFYGRSDVIIQSGDDLVGIYDFKRSESSIPSKKEFLTFEKLQLWFYLNRDKRIPKTFGYINLKEPTKSTLYCTDYELIEAWNSINIDPDEKNANMALLEDYSQMLTAYNENETELCRQIESEVNFSAKPRTPESCTYCQLNLVCKKGEY